MQVLTNLFLFENTQGSPLSASAYLTKNKKNISLLVPLRTVYVHKGYMRLMLLIAAKCQGDCFYLV